MKLLLYFTNNAKLMTHWLL